MTTTPTAPTPEELAVNVTSSLARHVGDGVVRRLFCEAIAAAIRQHSAPLEGQVEALRQENSDAEAALIGYEGLVSDLMNASDTDNISAAVKAGVAALERERVMREALTGLADVLERDCGVEPCASSMAPAERYLGMARNLLAALQPKEPAHDR